MLLVLDEPSIYQEGWAWGSKATQSYPDCEAWPEPGPTFPILSQPTQSQLLGFCVHLVFLCKSSTRIMSQVLPSFRGFCEIN